MPPRAVVEPHYIDGVRVVQTKMAKMIRSLTPTPRARPAASFLILLASQRQVDRLPGLGTADHGFGPLHVMHARFEGDHGDLLLAANGVGEFFLNAVVGLLLRRVGDLRELGIAAATGEDALLLVH